MDEIPSGSLNGISDEDVWEEVYAEQSFDFVWPPLIDAESNQVIATVTAVSAKKHQGVTFDLLGVRGAFNYIELFKPTILYASIERYEGRGSHDYLYSFTPDPNPFILVPYECTYSNFTQQTHIIRVWQDYNIVRDWIVAQVAAEVAYDAAIHAELDTLENP